MAQLSSCERCPPIAVCVFGLTGRTLRRVLRNASSNGLVSENTLLVLQGRLPYGRHQRLVWEACHESQKKLFCKGDLNSRTVLADGVKDILRELMADEKIQATYGLAIEKQTSRRC